MDFVILLKKTAAAFKWIKEMDEDIDISSNELLGEPLRDLVGDSGIVE